MGSLPAHGVSLGDVLFLMLYVITFTQQSVDLYILIFKARSSTLSPNPETCELGRVYRHCIGIGFGEETLYRAGDCSGRVPDLLLSHKNTGEPDALLLQKATAKGERENPTKNGTTRGEFGVFMLASPGLPIQFPCNYLGLRVPGLRLRAPHQLLTASKIAWA